MVKVEIINDNNLSEGLLAHMSILEGEFLCQSLVKVIKNKFAITSILNTTEKSVKINKICLKIEPIPCYNSTNIFHISKTPNNTNSDRLDDITNSLRLDHLNKEERNSIIELCHNYNQIFHLEGDLLTTTNAIMHEIKTTSNTPINSKTYRYPEVHKSEVNNQISKMLE